MPKWDLLVRIGKYFGVVPKKDADDWTEDDYQPFYFEISEDGELFAVAEDLEDEEEGGSLN
jgi:hypothetical protein|tara:strand:- start:1819 stop:2001 length:183 start_codon:yes stop_codon:yes gene_type:complete